MQSVKVRKIFADLKEQLVLETLGGVETLDRDVLEIHAQKVGLALAGFIEGRRPGRVQVMGRNEIAYLNTLSSEKQAESLELLSTVDVPVFVIARGLTPPSALAGLCERRKIALLLSPRKSSDILSAINRYLERVLAPSATFHGVLMDVLGVGTLIMGQSGVGKSEAALDLLQRGHRLVADDVVIARRVAHDVAVGSPDPPIKYLMEVRGLGIINIKDLFGIAAVKSEISIDLALKLGMLDGRSEFDRLGIRQEFFDVLGVQVPMFKIPVSSGRNLASIIEVAVRNFLVRQEGYVATQQVLDGNGALKRRSGDDR